MTGKNGPQRRPRDAASTRAALLRAATEVFADVGYAGARVDEIAHRARISQRMIYDYFGDKQGLYRKVLASRLCVTPFSRDDADHHGKLWTDEEFLEQGICRLLFDGIGAAGVSP